jgi:hypothetical protein
MIPPPDDLAPLLRPTPGPPPSAERRAALLAVTTRVVRRRVWFRRVTVAAGVLAVFALGAASGWLLKPTPEREVVLVTAPPVEPEPIPPPPSAAELELQAELADDRAEVARLYRAAGDAYLTVERDYVEAARCYRLFLSHADDAARRFATSDSWVLKSMKSGVQ